jgi:Ankyrin repeats (3 copies)
MDIRQVEERCHALILSTQNTIVEDENVKCHKDDCECDSFESNLFKPSACMNCFHDVLLHYGEGKDGYFGTTAVDTQTDNQLQDTQQQQQQHSLQSAADSLAAACAHGRLALVAGLLKVNADVNHCVNDEFDTPLILASIQGHAAIVKLLLSQQDIRVNQQNAQGWTALHVASAKGHVEVVQMLIDDGHASVDVDARIQCKHRQGTALFEAVYYGHVLCAMWLKECAGASVILGDGRSLHDVRSIGATRYELRELIEDHADYTVINQVNQVNQDENELEADCKVDEPIRGRADTVEIEKAESVTSEVCNVPVFDDSNITEEEPPPDIVSEPDVEQQRWNEAPPLFPTIPEEVKDIIDAADHALAPTIDEILNTPPTRPRVHTRVATIDEPWNVSTELEAAPGEEPLPDVESQPDAELNEYLLAQMRRKARRVTFAPEEKNEIITVERYIDPDVDVWHIDLELLDETDAVDELELRNSNSGHKRSLKERVQELANRSVTTARQKAKPKRKLKSKAAMMREKMMQQRTKK